MTLDDSLSIWVFLAGSGDKLRSTRHLQTPLGYSLSGSIAVSLFKGLQAIDYANFFPATTGCKKDLHNSPSTDRADREIPTARQLSTPSGTGEDYFLLAATAATSDDRN